jgi:hypothetical protein
MSKLEKIMFTTEGAEYRSFRGFFGQKVFTV